MGPSSGERSGRMNSYSTRLTWAGALLGALVLSATVFANARPPEAARTETTAAVQVLETVREPEAMEALAPESTAAGPFMVALRVGELPLLGRTYLCDKAGCPLAELEVDRDGDGVMGPLAPGLYTLWQDGQELGGFRLLENAALDRVSGQLWTDGELLHFERFTPGAAALTVVLPEPGYYSLELYDRYGRRWSRDFYVPDSAKPDRGRSWVRVLEFRGLPAGVYTAVRKERPLLQFEVCAGAQTEAELTIEN